MKAILIDAKNRVVKEIEIGNDYKEISKAIGCQYFTVATDIEKNDSIYVDDEGLFNEPHHFFLYEGAHQPFAGNGLVLGVDKDGESVSVRNTIDEIKSKTRFLDIFELRLAYMTGKIKTQ